MSKKKELKRSFTFRAKDNEHEAILKWLNDQNNVTDSIRYLIEKEIMQNGIRNLQNNIPSERPFNPEKSDIYGMNQIVANPQNLIDPSILTQLLAQQNGRDTFVPVQQQQVEFEPVKEQPKKKKQINKALPEQIKDEDEDIACWL